MRKLLLCSLFAVPSFLFSYNLEFSKSFYKNIQNDTLESRVEIIVDSKDIDFINEKIEFFQDVINDNSTVKKTNGNYSLLPNYQYRKNQEIFLGYRGSLYYNIETSQYEKLNQFILDLKDIKKNMNTNSVKLSISNLQWTVSKELYEKNINMMRIEAINWIKKYSKKLSDPCIIKTISINNHSGFNSSMYARGAMVNSSPEAMNIAPIQTKRFISINVHYKLDCK
ncbi:MAG: hypothetical protein CSA86_04520 [Arcobacter sp.]|nr:MAG: hypothetical protein CSA86_04520 [Arcobacter sp.]